MSPPAGYTTLKGSPLLVPNSVEKTPSAMLPAGKLKKGLSKAKKQIDETLSDVIEAITGSYEIAEIKLQASFSAEGKLLGFGVGGAMSIELTVRPCDS